MVAFPDTGAMPRAMWSGAISFGLVNVPVKLFSAKSEKSIRFNQIDTTNGARVRQKRVNEVTGDEVPVGNIAKGFEVEKDTYVLVTDDELAEFLPQITRSIDIECFVDLDEIDPIYYGSAYHVGPDNSSKAYVLLVRAMEASNKVAIAKFVMRSKQYAAVLRPKDGSLLLSVMVYADEIVPANQIESIDELEGFEVSDKELTMAQHLIESLSEEFDPASYHDEYRDQVLALIDKKAAGEDLAPQITAAPSSDRVVDLMAALEASVAAARDARDRHPTRNTA